MQTAYYFSVGQTPNPPALTAQCHKHGPSVWAVCDCNTRYYANVNRETTYNGLIDREIITRREDFPTLDAAINWGKTQVKKEQ